MDSKTIYMVCEHVDLGYHVVSAFYSREKANEFCTKLQANYEKNMINRLINHCGYDLDAARSTVRSPLQYFIEETELGDE